VLKYRYTLRLLRRPPAASRRGETPRNDGEEGPPRNDEGKVVSRDEKINGGKNG